MWFDVCVRLVLTMALAPGLFKKLSWSCQNPLKRRAHQQKHTRKWCSMSCQHNSNDRQMNQSWDRYYLDTKGRKTSKRKLGTGQQKMEMHIVAYRTKQAHQAGEHHSCMAAVCFRHKRLDAMHALLVWGADHITLLRPPVCRAQVAVAVHVQVVQGGRREAICEKRGGGGQKSHVGDVDLGVTVPGWVGIVGKGHFSGGRREREPKKDLEVCQDSKSVLFWGGRGKQRDVANTKS